MHQAENLTNKDSNKFNISDVCFEVEATDGQGRKRRQQTKTIWNSLNPVWNQAIEFESRDWRSFRVVLWDDDSDVPRRRARLSKFQTYSLTSYTPTVNETGLLQAMLHFLIS